MLSIFGLGKEFLVGDIVRVVVVGWDIGRSSIWDWSWAEWKVISEFVFEIMLEKDLLLWWKVVVRCWRWCDFLGLLDGISRV